MRTMWRRACAVAVAPLVMASAVACGGDSDQAAGGTTLRVIVNITPNLTEKYWNTLFDSYEKAHPGVTVKLELTGTIAADAKLRQDLAAGDPPDVVQQITPTADTASLFADLSDQAWATKTPLADQYAVDGKHYMVGVGEQIQSLVFYNKAAFEKAGLDASAIRTMDDFTAAMGKLKGAGYQPLQTAGQWVTGGQFSMMADAGVLTADPKWMAKRNAKKTSFADSGYVPYLKDYKGWIDKGYLQKSALGVTYADGQTAFLNGKSAMYVMGSFFVPAADAAKKSDGIGVFTMPTDGAYPSGQFGNVSNPYVVVNKSPHKAEAIKFVKWATTDPKAIKSQLASDGNLRQGFSYPMSSLGTSVQKILDKAPSVIVKSGENQPIAGFSDELNKQVQSLYTGASPKAVADGLDKWWNSQQ
ncbi:ABC transporter substrate-binding protein [Streptomyces sp. VRA16 Mangrove soil]|uniref:ABC transporter substrate-binding protein n=1 Tax=Streptomyces sp. VRA16 Mangrove soil TaxID=2817434 RepID=UPI001A9D3E88|nr:extracellular solute-binding protein [Streptomyces sp. VRA16 Mangrove soil]MBO1331429.1 extracellular solute-binding protein [Streptomyces sp. VRA16 Mangrove soil]